MDKCIRCGNIGQDRRTLRMDCFYEMSELPIPFGKEILFEVNPGDLGPDSITLESGRFKYNGEIIPKFLYTLRVCKRCRAEWLSAIENWFLAAPQGEDLDADDHISSIINSGIFIRENGATKEISEEEWYKRYPDREPVRVVLKSEKIN